MSNISAFIIAKNEEARIARSIKSLQNVADEIIVIDSGSDDNTVEIAKSLGATTYYNEWPGYVEQKSFGENLCKNNWIINIDADEELSKDLIEEINYIFKANIQDRYKAYSFDVTIVHRHDDRVRKFAPYNRVIRLYNKNFANFANSKGDSTHDSVVLNKEYKRNERNVYQLNEIAYHYSGFSITQLVDKANFYSSEQATNLVEKGKKISNVRIIFELFATFLKAFFIRRYFVFGINGFVDSVIFAFARFLRLAKTREAIITKENHLND